MNYDYFALGGFIGPLNGNLTLKGDFPRFNTKLIQT